MEETVRQKLEKMLIANGMFESQAKEVIEIAIPSLNDLVDDYKITFDSPSSDYPNRLYNTLYLIIKPIALEWIEENKPMAWFKPMFE